MLRKLMKYEWKATKRIFLPLYGAMLVAAFINGIFLRIDHMGESELMSGIKVLMIFAYVAIIIATLVMTAVVMIQRYYKNILGREGYLMNTLPVTGSELIWSKAIISTIWFVGSTIVIMISVPLIFLITNPEIFKEVFGEMFTKEFWSIITSRFESVHVILWGIELLIAGIVSCMGSCMKVYAAMSLGHLIQKSRMIASVGFFIALDFAERMIVLIITILAGVLFDSVLKFQVGFVTNGDGILAVHFILFGIILYSVIITVVYFLLSKTILEKKLNLE